MTHSDREITEREWLEGLTVEQQEAYFADLEDEDRAKRDREFDAGLAEVEARDGF